MQHSSYWDWIIKFLFEKITIKQHFVLSLFNLLGMICLIIFFTRFVDNRKFTSLGFHQGFILKDISIGVMMGMVIMVAGCCILVLSVQIHIDKISYDLIDLLLLFGIYVCVSISEELFFREYILSNLFLSFNKYIALTISSVMFCVMHFANPNLNGIGLTALFLAGLLLGYCYITTKNLWLPMALHFSWNLFQALLGFNVSGNKSYSIVTTSFANENIWNGGFFGFEGSVLSLVFQPLAMIFAFYMFKNRKFNLGNGLITDSSQSTKES